MVLVRLPLLFLIYSHRRSRRRASHIVGFEPSAGVWRVLQRPTGARRGRQRGTRAQGITLLTSRSHLGAFTVASLGVNIGVNVSIRCECGRSHLGPKVQTNAYLHHQVMWRMRKSC